MTNQELNEKLARWAGFTLLSEHARKQLECAIWLEPKETKWQVPQKNGELPDFTGSLDACFRWLVPKGIKFIQDKNVWNYQQSRHLLFDCWQALLNEDDYPLALCLAIEKLIDN